MTIDEQIEVMQDRIKLMQAFKAGKIIESHHVAERIWAESEHPIWDFQEYVYRVQKIPQEFLIYTEENGNLRCCRNGESTLAYQGKIPPHLTFLCKAKEF